MRIHPLITKSDDLKALVDRLAQAAFVAVDTEFMRENTYWPDLCLIQVGEHRGSRGDRSQGRGHRPRRRCSTCSSTNEDVLKVFHAGGQDLEIIHNLTGKVPAPAVRHADRGDGARARRADRLFESDREPARAQPRQGRALHRLEPPPARQAPDRLCDRRRHPPRHGLPAHGREAEEDRPRRLARRGDGAARRPVELRLPAARTRGSASSCRAATRRCSAG